jgi:hypothetical protein
MMTAVWRPPCRCRPRQAVSRPAKTGMARRRPGRSEWCKPASQFTPIQTLHLAGCIAGKPARLRASLAAAAPPHIVRPATWEVNRSASPRASGNPGDSTFTFILGMCWREPVNPSQTGAMARSRVWLPSVLMSSPWFCGRPAPVFLCPGRCVDREECGEALPPVARPARGGRGSYPH